MMAAEERFLALKCFSVNFPTHTYQKGFNILVEQKRVPIASMTGFNLKGTSEVV
jgi:hypothetical protein